MKDGVVQVSPAWSLIIGFQVRYLSFLIYVTQGAMHFKLISKKTKPQANFVPVFFFRVKCFLGLRNIN